MAVPEGSTDIRVATPLPSSVLMTLGRLIDLAWPGAELATGNRGEITFRVNRAAASDITADEAAGAKVELAEGDVAIQELGPEGVSLVTPAALAASLLPILKASFQENPDAANYLETTVTDPDDYNRYVLIFAPSAQQTPHELRMTAEKRLATARQDAHRTERRLRIQAAGQGPVPTPSRQA
jgi:hypothetical protein